MTLFLEFRSKNQSSLGAGTEVYDREVMLFDNGDVRRQNSCTSSPFVRYTLDSGLRVSSRRVSLVRHEISIHL